MDLKYDANIPQEWSAVVDHFDAVGEAFRTIVEKHAHRALVIGSIEENLPPPAAEEDMKKEDNALVYPTGGRIRRALSSTTTVSSVLKRAREL